MEAMLSYCILDTEHMVAVQINYPIFQQKLSKGMDRMPCTSVSSILMGVNPSTSTGLVIQKPGLIDRLCFTILIFRAQRTTPTWDSIWGSLILTSKL